MCGDDGFVDSVDMLHQVSDLGSVFLRETVACRVGNIHHCGSGLDYGLDHPGQVLVVGSSGILSVELDILNASLRILDGADCPFENILPVGFELVPDVGVGSPDSGVDSLVLCVLQGIGSCVDVLFHGSGQSADGRPGDSFRNLDHGVEVSGAGDREASLDGIHAEGFESFCELNLLDSVELASRYLLTVSEGGVEKEDFVLVHCYLLFSSFVSAYIHLLKNFHVSS